MSLERDKKCRDCIFGQVSQPSSFELPLSPISSVVIIPPRVTRNCLNRREVFVDNIADWIEEKIGLDIAQERISQVVPFAARCQKPEKYFPKD